jgi:hypothetical protein
MLPDMPIPPQTMYSAIWNVARKTNIATAIRLIRSSLYFHSKYIAKPISIINVANITGGEKQYMFPLPTVRMFLPL